MKLSSLLKPAMYSSAFIAMISFSSCNSGSATSGYSTSANGLDYKIITDNKQTKAKIGDYVQYYSALRTTNDSLVFAMNKTASPEIGMVSAAKDKGDPIEILTMVGKGDSVSCLIPAETFFKGVEIPAPLKKGDKVKLELKIVDVFAKADYDAKMTEMEMQKNAAAEAEVLNYIKEHNLNAQRLPSGMYLVVDNPGTGATPENGKKVKVNYRGTLFNGTEFDSSMKPGRTPFEFVLGQGQVIKGWDQGIPMFKVGGKGKLLIPPAMGYGEQGQGNIPANSWLVFDIEVLGVSDAAPKGNPQPIQIK